MTMQTFEEQAERNGLKSKVFYTVGEVAQVLGIPPRTVYEEVNEGRMAYHLAPGRTAPKLVRACWVDDWIERGTHGTLS